MRFVVLAAAAVAVSMPAFADDKCKGEVEAAFVKQRLAPAFRTVATTDTPNGAIVRTIEFVAPDRLYSKIVSPAEEAPVETIGIGKFAWANTQGGWEEQPPHMAQMVSTEREAYKVPPKAATDFTCLGIVKANGKDAVGYAAPPAKNPDGREVVTIIHVDPATGLPVSYVTAATKYEGPAVFKAEYSYGSDIAIVSPLEAPPAEVAPAAAAAPEKK
jgi:hypothetical protein